MYYERMINVVKRLCELTRIGRLTWKPSVDGWYTAELHEGCVSIRLLNYEAENQVGADPRMFEISMAGFNQICAFGTEGACVLFELLGYAGVGYPHVDEHIAGLDLAESILDRLVTD